MKYVMQVCKHRRQSNTISYFSHFFGNLEWSNKTRSQLLRLQCPTNSRHRSNSHKHMVSLLKLKCFPPLVMITLLTTLRSFHLLLNHLNLLCSLLYNFWSNHNTLTSFVPTQWSSTSPTMQRLKRSHTYTRMKTVVVGKFNQRQITIHAPPFSNTQARNKSSNDWIVLSVCP